MKSVVAIIKCAVAVAAVAAAVLTPVESNAQVAAGIRGVYPAINTDSEFYTFLWSGPAKGVPTIVTNASAVLLTNISAAIIKDTPVVFTATIASSAANAASNNVAGYFDLSYDGGRTFTAHRPLSVTGIAPNVLGSRYLAVFTLQWTNLAGATDVRFTALSNAIPAGSAAQVYYATNVSVAVRRR